MNPNLQKILEGLFEKHRVVFWYDTESELRAEFAALEFDSVEKIELKNNEFGVKHRVMREAKKQKFLLFQDGPQPEDASNWLLDVLLAHTQFNTDQVGMWLSELELGPEFRELVSEHAAFFNAESRRADLQKKPDLSESLGSLRLKMMAVGLHCEPRADSILEALLNDLAQDKEAGYQTIQKYGLDTHLWSKAEQQYGYRSDACGPLDFALELFKSAFAHEAGGEPTLRQEANVFLQRWMSNRRCAKHFETLSHRLANDLDIQNQLEALDYRSLLNVDLFDLVDQRIIGALVAELVANEITPEQCLEFVRQRRQAHWYEHYVELYKTLENAAEFRKRRLTLNPQVQSIGHGITNYAKHWYELDYYYRKFITHANRASQPGLNALREQIENHYTNSYLLPLNNSWQSQVDQQQKWGAGNTALASEFFEQQVRPILAQDQKVVVFISDALRYEAGVELVSRIRQLDRYEARVEPMLSMLPSYTQLGMAALLPHKVLSLADATKATVQTDGLSTVGTDARGKVLNAAVPAGAIAIQARDVIKLGKAEARQLFKDHSVIYVYHNRIDAVGDKRDTEEQVFNAVDQSLEELIDLIKRMASANATNMMVTADHGFIYQDRALDESDFLAAEPVARKIDYKDRRFVIGEGFEEQSGFKMWTSEQLGLAGDAEFQIPKSINRLRLRGSGSRFVHGGAALQEVVIPLVTVSKKRQSDIGKVEVDVIQSTNTISSNQLTVAFYQASPASDKKQGRKLTAAFYSADDEEISGRQELVFDSTSDNAREREQKAQFILTHDADKHSGQEVELRLEEPIVGTARTRKYKQFSYTLRISFSRDFDF